MIVVDNSVIVAVLVGPDPLSSAIRRRLSRERLFAPELIDVEALSAIRGLVHGGKLALPLAEGAVAALRTLPMERVPHLELMPRVWQLRDHLTAYDATYVALAEALDATLVTGDHRLARASGMRCAIEVVGAQSR